MSTRKLLIEGDRKFTIVIPEDATVTYGPWSPPPAKEGSSPRHWPQEERRGTLRIYKGKSKTDILAVFSGVTSFRDMSIEYAEEVFREVGESVWRSDEKGYHKESKTTRTKALISPEEDM